MVKIVYPKKRVLQGTNGLLVAVTNGNAASQVNVDSSVVQVVAPVIPVVGRCLVGRMSSLLLLRKLINLVQNVNHHSAIGVGVLTRAGVKRSGAQLNTGLSMTVECRKIYVVFELLLHYAI